MPCCRTSSPRRWAPRGPTDRDTTAPLDLADADVLVEAHVVAHEVLEDHADRPAHRRQVVVAQVDAVEQDAPLGRIVEPRQQLGERRLARAVLADERDALAGTQRKLTCRTAQRRCRDSGSRRLRTRSPRDRPGHRWRAGVRDRRLHLEEDEQVFEVETLLVDAAGAEQQMLDESRLRANEAARKVSEPSVMIALRRRARG